MFREYHDYPAYIAHQRAKMAGLTTASLTVPDDTLFGALMHRYRGVIRSGARVLCLGARFGAEVRAFREMGAFAFGIDLCVNADNPYVLYGDMHGLQFSSGVVDVVYTNCLDHALNPQLVVDEAFRVLDDGGRFYLEAQNGTGAGQRPGEFEAFYWRSINDLIELVSRPSLVLMNRTAIQVPWPGEQLKFERMDL